MEEQTAGSLSMFQKVLREKKTVFIVAGICIFISYIAINIGIWTYAKKSGKSAQTVAEKIFIQPIGPSSTPTPTPTPRLTGPGPYACDPLGLCNNYKDAKGAGCPKTYADSGCLGECGNTAVRCPK